MKYLIKRIFKKYPIFFVNLFNKMKLNMDKKKEFIYSIANSLILANGKTTNLDIKNLAHSVWPGCGISQHDVSQTMNDLFNEKNIWERDNTSTGGKYFEYTLRASTSGVDYVAAAQQAVKDYQAKYAANAPVASAPTATTNIKLVANVHGSVAALGATLKTYDPKLYIAYSRKHAAILTNTTDRYVARNIFKQQTGEKHNDVCMMQISTYLRTHKL